MFEILTLNKISKTGLDKLDGAKYTCSDSFEAPDAVLVRSASMHETVLPEKTVAIARAGAGVNNIPVDACSEKGVVVFNTPGANANAVKELVICALFMSSRKSGAALDWCKTLKGEGENVGKLVEKGKGTDRVVTESPGIVQGGLPVECQIVVVRHSSLCDRETRLLIDLLTRSLVVLPRIVAILRIIHVPIEDEHRIGMRGSL